MRCAIINHRRDRRQTRRILADIRVQFHDLNRAPLQEIDAVERPAGSLSCPASIGGRH